MLNSYSIPRDAGHQKVTHVHAHIIHCVQYIQYILCMRCICTIITISKMYMCMCAHLPLRKKVIKMILFSSRLIHRNNLMLKSEQLLPSAVNGE